MTTPLLTDLHLEVLYQRTTGAIAFVDETYRDNTLAEQPFYAMSAVTFSKNQLDPARRTLTNIAGERFWHTTDALQAGRGEDIAEMAQWIADQAQWNVVTTETIVTNHGGLDEARQTCLAALVREVTRGTGPQAVRLIVADASREPHTNRSDRMTIARLRTAKDIPQTVRFYHGRMGEEPVLWTADLVAWASRRAIALDDTRWLDLLEPVLTVLDARTGHTLKMQQPRAAAATLGVQRPDAPGDRGPAAVAETSVTPTDETWEAHTFDRGTKVLDSLVQQAASIRLALGVPGVVGGNSPAAVARRARAQNEGEPSHGGVAQGPSVPPA
ncbi:MAG: hypothetical protein FWD11_01385 [Micrococcales bacterium]|nr:hypothetical protein [Micrococcales bacterium]